MKKSIVMSVRISEDLNNALNAIADKNNLSFSHLINSVLSSFCLEYSKSLVENLSLNEDSESN